jgi:serine/threonine protein kinase
MIQSDHQQPSGTGQMNFCLVCLASFRPFFTHCPRDGSKLRSGGEDPLFGRILADRYRIISHLGTGGMGTVYKAEHVEMGKLLALKILFGDFALNEKMFARFRREARAASLLHHINIVSVTDFGITKTGLPYLAMEFLAGRSLAGVLQTEGPFSPARAVHIGKQIASALSHAHDKGILHRDLKPENVVLEDREESSDFATVLDFGLAGLLNPDLESAQARLTLKGRVVGTPEYMSPEQAQGFELEPSSDLYSLGIILYCMLSQRFPFPQASTRQDMLTMQVFSQPIPLSQTAMVPPEFDTLVMRLLNKSPKLRYATGREVVIALDEALEAARKNHVKNAVRGIGSVYQTDLSMQTVKQFMEAIDAAGTQKMSRLESHSSLDVTPVDPFFKDLKDFATPLDQPPDPYQQVQPRPRSSAEIAVFQEPYKSTQPMPLALISEALSQSAALSRSAQPDVSTDETLIPGIPGKRTVNSPVHQLPRVVPPAAAASSARDWLLGGAVLAGSILLGWCIYFFVFYPLLRR